MQKNTMKSECKMPVSCSKSTALLFVLAIALLVAIITCIVIYSSEDYVLDIVHFNDFHSRFQEISPEVGRCTPTMNDCIGGFARMYSAIMQLMHTKKNPILLCSGDNLQGSIWYRLFRWNVSVYFMNKLPVDVYTMGNHDFEDGLNDAVPYITGLNAPMVLANLNSSLEPTMQGIYQKSIVFVRKGKRIGIVGVLTTDTQRFTDIKKLVLTDEISAVENEAKTLRQKSDIVIVLSHCGSVLDRKIAQQVGPYIDIIVGGHSHSLFYHGKPPASEIAEADYPDVVELSSGKKIPIVQSSSFSRFIGCISIKIDKNNKISGWDGNSIYMSHDLPKDENIERELDKWQVIVDADPSSAVVGTATTFLSIGNCAIGECNIGNFYADAMVSAWPPTSDNWAPGPISLMIITGIRASIPVGNITREDVLISLPYRDTWDFIEIKGKYIVETLEFAARGSLKNPSLMNALLQVSGIKYTIDITAPNGQRVKNVLFKSDSTYDPIDPETSYSVVLQWYLCKGNDGFTMVKDNMIRHETGPQDMDVVLKYLEKNSPIATEITDRITIKS